MLFLFVILTSLAVGFLVMPIIIKVLWRAKIGDQPGGRKIHKKFVPSMGGIGFFIAAAAAMAIWGDGSFPFLTFDIFWERSV